MNSDVVKDQWNNQIFIKINILHTQRKEIEWKIENTLLGFNICEKANLTTQKIKAIITEY